MLVDKAHPMMAAAALRAIALARDPSFRPKAAAGAELEVPKIDHGTAASSGGSYGYHGGFYGRQRQDP
jgi:hypothetical protein